jgi:flagellar biosynthesis protein FliR
MESLWWGILAAGRVLPGLLLIPAFGGRRMPVPVSLGLTVVVVLAVLPSIQGESIVPGSVLWVGLLVKELCVGTFFALVGCCLFDALLMGGQLSDTFRGAAQSRSRLFHASGQASPLAVLHLLLACLVFFQVDGPARFFQVLNDSYLDLPIDSFPASAQWDQVAGLALTLSAQALLFGVSIALPLAGCILCTDLLLGFVNRAAPQIQVFFLGMPLRALVGIVVVALCLERSVDYFAL